MEAFPDLFLITSVIETGQRGWSYTSVRSVFTPEQRFQQTLQSIQSIREAAPEATIMICEASPLSDSMREQLRAAVDIALFLDADPTIQDVCLTSPKKGYGELLQTVAAVEHLKNTGVGFRRLFKLSGRYKLNHGFRLSNFSTTDFTFRASFPGSAVHPTVLYAVPFAQLGTFENALADCRRAYETQDVVMYENALPGRCNPKHLVTSCGVSGYVAVDGVWYEDA